MNAHSLTNHDLKRSQAVSWTHILVFVSGLGMAFFSALTIQHFFAANYPESIFEGSFCDLNAFFNCDSSAYSPISSVLGVPLGYFGLLLGSLFAIGAVFPSTAMERTNRSLALLNFVGVVGLLSYSVLFLKSLCLLCTGFYVSSFFALLVLWIQASHDGGTLLERFFLPSPKHLATFAVVLLVGAWGFAEYHTARRGAQVGGTAARVVEQFFSLEPVAWPSFISPLWTARSTGDFEEAPIRIVEYADILCPDCQFLGAQLNRLKEEFAGKINIAFQMFPLEAECNDVVTKDLHPGACQLSYAAAHDPEKFLPIHDEIFANLQEAKSSAEWRRQLIQKYGVEDALADPETIALVQRMIRTGGEYERTSDQYAHGIRSTPTMIINNRMIIGTLPYEHLRAIFQALVQEAEGGSDRFMESWVETG